MTSGRVLLTVSGVIPADLDADVAAGRRPRADYRVVADRLGADVVDVAAALDATGAVGRVLHRLGGAGPLLAWYAFRRRDRYDVVLTDGEQVGLPLALLGRLTRRRQRHVMIVHILTTRSKAALVRLFRLGPLIDRFLVYSSRQRDLISQDLGIAMERIALVPFMVDSAFFDPGLVDVEPRRRICSAGLERRDYPTLMAAVAGLDVEVVIAAASPWSRQADSTEDQTIPPNVVVERLDLFALRELYASSSFVVMPLHDVDFQAGITTILEAMSMGRAIVCTRTPGQTDTVVDGVNGVYVPPADAAALRTTIVEMLDDQDRCVRLGRAGRDWVVEHADVERYAELLADEVAAAIGP